MVTHIHTVNTRSMLQVAVLLIYASPMYSSNTREMLQLTVLLFYISPMVATYTRAVLQLRLVNIRSFFYALRQHTTRVNVVTGDYNSYSIYTWPSSTILIAVPKRTDATAYENQRTINLLSYMMNLLRYEKCEKVNWTSSYWGE